MAGDPGHIVVPTIYAFGGTNFDAATALTSMVHAATTVTAEDLSHSGWNVMPVGERPSLDKYMSLKYVPADGNAWGGAGETLEDVAADFAISQLAQRLGNGAVHDQFLARSAYWRNVFHANASGSDGYIQDRNANGSWVGGFLPDTEQGFAEGSSAQYTWMIPFDVHGLFDAMGGPQKALARLDAFFHDGANWAFTNAGGAHAEMNNEPSIGAPLIYAFAGAPYKTQEVVRQVLNTMWPDSPSGIPGQDDLGAMSAWYAWSAMGLYPQYPGRAELLVIAPLFPQIVVRRSNGVVLTLKAPQAAAGTPYVQGLKLNGQDTSKAWLSESFVGQSNQLDFALSAQANPAWGAGAADAPPSFAP
jgi:predicted alpha-1,2-mannosidase